MIQHVFLVGASGVGKSTLAKAVAESLGWDYLPLSAGAAYKRHGVSFEQADADPELLLKIQEQICVDAAETIKTAVRGGKPFVADRSVDYGVYTALMCEVTGKANAAIEVMRWILTDPESRVFFCRPVESILAAARAGDGGRRSKFLSDWWVDRVDAALLAYLRMRRVRFTEVGAGSPAGRCRQVVEAVKGA